MANRLHRLTIRYRIKHLRGSDPSPARSAPVGPEKGSDDAPHPASPLFTKAKDTFPPAWQQALDTLSPELRCALLMQESEGLSYAKIAEAIQCTPAEVKGRIFQARESILAALDLFLNPKGL